jgi:hypothetical protein
MIIQLQNLQWGKGEDDVFAGVPIGGGRKYNLSGKQPCGGTVMQRYQGWVGKGRFLIIGYSEKVMRASHRWQIWSCRPPRLLTHFELLSSIDTFVGHGGRQQNVQLV